MSLFKKHARATAQILEMAPTPAGAKRTGARDPEFRFELFVTTADGSTFTTEHVCRVPAKKMPLPKDTLPVEVEDDARRVARICFGEMPDLAARALASAAAARAGDAAGAADALGFQLRDKEG